MSRFLRFFINQCSTPWWQSHAIKGQRLSETSVCGKSSAFSSQDVAQRQTMITFTCALAEGLGLAGTPGFIVGTELVPGALDVKGLKDLIARAGHGK
jgi:hypothetical protein